ELVAHPWLTGEVGQSLGPEGRLDGALVIAHDARGRVHDARRRIETAIVLALSTAAVVDVAREPAHGRRPRSASRSSAEISRSSGCATATLATASPACREE